MDYYNIPLPSHLSSDVIKICSEISEVISKFQVSLLQSKPKAKPMNFYSLNHFLIFHVKTDDCDDMKKILHIEKRPSLIAKMDNYALKSKKISLAQLSPSLTNTKNKLIL